MIYAIQLKRTQIAAPVQSRSSKQTKPESQMSAKQNASRLRNAPQTWRAPITAI